MDPIHPLRPTGAQPAPVQPVRRVTRAGEQDGGDERRPPRKRPPTTPAPPVTPPPAGDGHVDARA